MPKKLLIITQRVDESDDLLGFFVAWIREFAKHFDQVSVITLATGEYQLPSNVSVYSLGKEHGASKWAQVFRLFRLLLQLTPRHHAVFAHMSPIFVIAAWPFTFLFRKRLVLWYLHRSRTLRLRLALHMANTVVTADAASLTLQHPKIRSVGHGIDIGRFTTLRDWSHIGSRPLRIISVGRLSPIKDFATLIRAAALLRERHVPIEVRIVGRAVMARDHAYEQQLRSLVQELGLSDTVTFEGFVPYRDMPAQYRWADIAVGCTPHGGIDKVLLEAMAAGCVAITSNEAMQSTLGTDADHFLFQYGDARDLEHRIATISDWTRISAHMQRMVQERHELGKAISAISSFT